SRFLTMPVLAEKRGSVYWITISNPSRRNAITKDMYSQLCCALDEADADKLSLFTVITGYGDYYSSSDIFTSSDTATINSSELSPCSQFLNKIIDHRKILIGLVNGPAFGAAASALSLMDYVLCSDSAYFETPSPYISFNHMEAPFVAFEGEMGSSKACETILFGEHISAFEALKRGMVCHVFPRAVFKEESAALVKALASREVHRVYLLRKGILSDSNGEARLMKKHYLDESAKSLIRTKFCRAKI
ncbi:hypothetical protein PMAYCL1PPCAC_10754, partial [Pristionchus mayeri]